MTKTSNRSMPYSYMDDPEKKNGDRAGRPETEEELILKFGPISKSF